MIWQNDAGLSGVTIDAMSIQHEIKAAHTPVLLRQVVDLLCPPGREIRRFVDGTVGAGGHSYAMLAAGAESVLALDVDQAAIAAARETLAAFGERAHLRHASYTAMRAEALALGWDAVDAILLDLGLSSLQMDDAARGFAFRFDAPLDMRFDQTADQPTAADLVNALDEAALADLLWRYGDERDSRRIARAIVNARPLRSTRQLAELVAAAKRHRRKAAIHPATRVFQALRIAVNSELESVERALPIALNLLRPGGRLAVISFHSLEDRIVKRGFREMAREHAAPPGMASLGEKRAEARLLTRKPIVADAEERGRNPRSRSAKLRAIEKL